jgi:hypothetical protein
MSLYCIILLRRNAMDPKKPDPARVEALRNLPKEIMQSLTKEEVQVFLFDNEWPDSLREKLKDYIVDKA